MSERALRLWLHGLAGAEGLKLSRSAHYERWRYCEREGLLEAPSSLPAQAQAWLSPLTVSVGAALSVGALSAQPEPLPLLWSLTRSSLALGWGERWALELRPGLELKRDELAPPLQSEWARQLWGACERLIACGRGDVTSYRGELLLPSEPPLSRADSQLSDWAYHRALEERARAEYERCAWVTERLIEDSPALRALSAQLSVQLSDHAARDELLAPYSPRELLIEPALILAPRQLISALERALEPTWSDRAQSSNSELSDDEREELEGGERRWLEGARLRELGRPLSDERDELDERDEGDQAEQRALEGGLLPSAELAQAIWDEVAPHLNELIERLELASPPERSLKLSGLFESGREVSLRALMSAEARPEGETRVWRRAALPRRQAQATLLLVDLSASMRGARLDALLEALSLACLALAQLELPFALYGFQDELIELLSFEDPKPAALTGLTATLEAVYGEVWAERPGGRNRPQYNDDGPCLEEAVSRLRATQARRRALWVLSDGLPRGARSGLEELRAVIQAIYERSDVALLGLGVGPETSHVERLYPVARGDVPLERLAETLGALLIESQSSLR